MDAQSDTVDIICPVFNGAGHLAAFLESVQAQTHPRWRLWIRDDGSADGSVGIANVFAAAEHRISLLESGGVHLGVVGAFGWLFERVPRDSAYLMFADQDDVWVPTKIEASVAAMQVEERKFAGPVLVHSDLVVVDATLNEIDSSFWHFAAINPESPSLQHLVVKNVVTGATMMLNRALRERVGAIPPAAAVHDWWVACVARAFGHIVAVRACTVMYRQHGANSIGARRPSSTLSWEQLPREALSAFARLPRVRAGIAAAARQAAALLERYGDELPAGDRRFLAAYAQIPRRGFLRRKFDVMRMQLLAENGLVQNVGILLRA